jgi:hypothetical protein
VHLPSYDLSSRNNNVHRSQGDNLNKTGISTMICDDSSLLLLMHRNLRLQLYGSPSCECFLDKRKLRKFSFHSVTAQQTCTYRLCGSVRQGRHVTLYNKHYAVFNLMDQLRDPNSKTYGSMFALTKLCCEQNHIL